MATEGGGAADLNGRHQTELDAAARDGVAGKPAPCFPKKCQPVFEHWPRHFIEAAFWGRLVSLAPLLVLASSLSMRQAVRWS